MVSPFLSGIVGTILAPILPQFALNKLLDSLLEYLSRDQPSSSSSNEAESKLQQLKNEREDMERANRKLETMQDAVKRLHKLDKENKTLIHINNELRDVSYQIQDLKDDLEYMELQRKVEAINLQDEAENISPSRTGQTSNKRLRFSSSESTDDILNKMRTIIGKINLINSEMNHAIKLNAWCTTIEMALKGGYDSYGQHQIAENKRVTTSSPAENKIYGRDYEFRRLIELVLREPNVSGNVSVVPIVGMGGVGKTTLAQFVFNSTEIATQFDKKAWICVSDHFDRFRITKEILDSISDDRIGKTTSLDVLEREIKRQVKEKKFLLVLDDIWSDEWRALLNFLQFAEAKAIKLIVTCRDPKVLGVVTDRQTQITLNGLSDGDSWLFFMKCAFADKNPDNYPQLHLTGKKIVEKLKGSPLATKTVGRLLGDQLTEKHWKDVFVNDLWKLETDAHGIMSALALSYHHLPQPLQFCFAFCSVFPKDFVYDRNCVIGMWIAHGYIQEIEGSSKTLEDIGEEYCHELENRGFFEKYFYGFKMHDLLHDLAQSVSNGEIYIWKTRKDEKIPKNVRHLCAHNFFDLQLVQETNNLRTLVLYEAGDIRAILNHRAFKRIRVLGIFNLDVQELPDDIAHLKHLQYLDLGKTNIKSIPESLCGLYLLKVLRLSCEPLTLPSRFDNLINLRTWRMFQGYQNFLEYRVKSKGGYLISQIKNMNELTGKLLIEGLENIDNMEEMMKAKYLKEKRHIQELTLSWRDPADGCKHDIQEQVLQALQPHPNLNYLRINGYMGSKSPSWLMTHALQNLQKISLFNCRKWARLPAAVGLLPSLKTLMLIGIENMTIECGDSVTEMYPSLQSLHLTEATLYFEGMPLSASSSSPSSSSLTTLGHCKWFPHLQNLKVHKSDRVSGFPSSMLPPLNKLGKIVRRRLNKCRPASPSGLGHLSYLGQISLMEVKVTVDGITPVFPSLNTLTLEKKASMMVTVKGVNLVFPSLRTLKLEQKASMMVIVKDVTPVFPSLRTLALMEEASMKVIKEGITPVFPSLHTLELGKKTSREVTVEGVVTPVFPYHHTQALVEVVSMKVTLDDVTPVFPSLHTLKMECASVVFQNMSSSSSSPSSSATTQNHNHFPKLTTLTINSCDEVKGLSWPLSSTLEELCIGDSRGLDDQLPGCLNGLSALSLLDLHGAGIQIFPAKVMATLYALKKLHLKFCWKLISLEGLQALPSLKELDINYCPIFRSWGTEETTEDGSLLPNLQKFQIWFCEDLESLPSWLPCLPLLKELAIRVCPKVHSLPKGGLPSSLEMLHLEKCDLGLMKRCQQEGSLEWQMTRHIPQRKIKFARTI